MKQILVWDLALRLFHWLLVPLVFFSWWSAENGAMQWHQYSGYGVLGLLVFRIYWGFFGSTTAKFKNFLTGIKPVVEHIEYALSRKQKNEMGHNPLGGWSTVVLLLVLAVQVITGLFTVDVDGLESGPLSYLVSFDQGRSLAEFHEWSFDALLILIGLHVLAILWYELACKERLIMPMIHGYKKMSIAAVDKSVRVNIKRLLVGIFLSGLLVYLSIDGFRF